MKVTTNWEYSRETEACRVVNTAAKTANLFYFKHGFLVLPEVVGNVWKAVYLPDWNYDEVEKGFWGQVAKTDYGSLIWREDELAKRINGLVKERQMDVETLREKWETVEDDFWKNVGSVFPEMVDKEVKLLIKPTEYGSGVSYSMGDMNERVLNLAVWWRQDISVDRLAHGVLSALVMNSVRVEGYSWEESEVFVDLLFRYGGLSKLFPGFVGTTRGLKTAVDQQWIDKANDYMCKLGILAGLKAEIKEDDIWVNERMIKGLTKSEYWLLKCLVENRGRVVAWETMGDNLWPDEPEKFSLWAMRKLVQRLRRKLQSQGFADELIESCRGRGYRWGGKSG